MTGVATANPGYCRVLHRSVQALTSGTSHPGMVQESCLDQRSGPGPDERDEHLMGEMVRIGPRNGVLVNAQRDDAVQSAPGQQRRPGRVGDRIGLVGRDHVGNEFGGAVKHGLTEGRLHSPNMASTSRWSRAKSPRRDWSVTVRPLTSRQIARAITECCGRQ